MKNVVLIGMVFVLLLSCHSTNTKTPESNNTEWSIESILDTCDYYKIMASYPVTSLDSAGTMKEFVQYRVDQKKEEWKEGSEVYNQYQEALKAAPERAGMKYEFNISYQEYLSKKQNTTSYVYTTYEFTGGANGTSLINTFSFTDKGRKLVIEDILNLNDSTAIEVSRLLADKVLQDTARFNRELLMDGLGLSFLKEDGFTLDKEKCKCDGFFYGSNLQNFIIQDEGISFIFNQYQIAAGSYGTPEIKLSWSELTPYLQPNILPAAQ